MYSVILLVSMSASPTEPQGILFNRGGCNGQPVRAVVQAVVGKAGLRVRAMVGDRPTPIRSLLSRVGSARGGCHGTTYGSVSASVTVQAQALPMPRAEAPSKAVPPTVEGPVRRIVVRKQLRTALERSNSPAAKAALADPDVFDALAAKVYRDLSRAAMQSGAVGRLGDGTILQKILDNLPAILDALERILKILG